MKKQQKKIKNKKEKGIDDNDNELNEMQREPELPEPKYIKKDYLKKCEN